MQYRRVLCTVTGATVALVSGVVAVGPAAAATVGGVTSRVSVASNGRQGNADSGYGDYNGYYDVQETNRVAISAGGRFVAFSSAASNLVPGDTNAAGDVFVRDRLAGVTRRVSVASSGQQADGPSSAPAISADGRFVAFASAAANLVPGDTNGSTDVFVRDRLAGKTRRVSVASSGQQANGPSSAPAISADGRFVAFTSDASNLVLRDTNDSSDVFVRDLLAGVTRRVSLTTQGRQGDSASYSPSISGDGRYVAFQTDSYNLQQGLADESAVVVRDRLAGVTLEPMRNNDDAMFGESPAVSADGRYVAYVGFLGPECCPSPQMFVWNRMTRRTQPLSAEISGDSSNATFGPPAISADGRYVAFSSDSNVVKRDTNGAWDVFVRDRLTRVTRRVSIASNGQQANADSLGAAITADGSSVAFASDATNLVRGDTNNSSDVFVRDPLLGTAPATAPR